ncbi:hypothetical protein F3Y22_tig00014064pilonHSYRG00115 [Hibiscus syriacus]|uniref:DUF1985 domain-containing protein n=1 Tax=Hibiscus syriacus TaxID=106335 RepID=A0A6A3C0C6_HIBSY|nr:hypothetical protein F3Y22_tig00014064pilonHSYRG00115 [Hibiscus syriacus]
MSEELLHNKISERTSPDMEHLKPYTPSGNYNPLTWHLEPYTLLGIFGEEIRNLHDQQQTWHVQLLTSRLDQQGQTVPSINTRMAGTPPPEATWEMHESHFSNNDTTYNIENIPDTIGLFPSKLCYIFSTLCADNDEGHTSSNQGNLSSYSLSEVLNVKMRYRKCRKTNSFKEAMIDAKSTIATRNLTSDPSCLSCIALTETALHVLRDCLEVKTFWQGILPPMVSLNFFTTDIVPWLTANLSETVVPQGFEISWSLLFVSLLWKLWKRRNNGVFSGEAQHLHVIFQTASSWAQYFNSMPQSVRATASASHRSNGWTKLADGWYCLNCDGSVASPCMMRSAGGVLRDQNAWRNYAWETRLCCISRNENLVADGLAKMATTTLAGTCYFDALPNNFYSAQLTLRNKVSLAKTIASKLSPAQRKMFEDTCFGPWLKVQHPGGDAMLTHLFLQTMTSDLPETIQRRDEEIWFDFPPAYTCFRREEFCLITGLRFGHDDVGRYTRHITRPSWLSRVFLELERPNLYVEDLTRLLNKKDGFTRMDDVDVVRVCLLILLHAGFLGREARQPIPNDLIKLVEDLNAWNLFPWGSYLWKATWNKLSSALDDRKSLHGDGSKYTLTGFIWAFKIWIFEAFPAMKTYAIKTSNDIPRAISWKRKRTLQWEDLLRYTTINNEANTPLQRLTPTEAELATDWWQASKHFFDGTVDEQPPLREPSPRPELSPHPEPSSDRPGYTPPQRHPSPILSYHRASSPPSPQDRRPAKMPRRLSPCSPPLPQRDELGELRDEVNALREEVGTLRKDDGAWRVEVSTLRGEVAALREMVASLQNEVHTLRNEFTHQTTWTCYYVSVHPNSAKTPQEEARLTCHPSRVPSNRSRGPYPPSRVPPTVQEATVIVEEVPPTIPEPDSHGVIYRSIEKPPPVPNMMDESWLSYEFPASTLPVSEVEMRQLPETIVDNTLWAKTAVDFYLHERSQGCYTDISKLNDEMFLLLDRSWWGVLLGVEDSGYFDGEHIDAWVSRLLIIRKLRKNKKNSRYTIMSAAFHAVHLKNQRDESFSLGNGQAKLYPAWWEVDKVSVYPCFGTSSLASRPTSAPIPEDNSIYDSMINYISLSDLRDIIKGWSSHLAKFLDGINYWTHSGHKKPKKFNVTVVRDETVPQQSPGGRGDCGPLVCMCLARLTTGSTEFLPPTDRDRAAVGLWFRHYMARAIYSRRCLPASAL